MADTRQIVSWALKRQCSLRKGKNWHDPNATRESLYKVQRCAERMAGEEIVDGFWVTSTYWGHDANDNSVDIPCSGVRVDDVARDFGGWDIVREACRGCEANVYSKDPSGVAGCHGSIDVMYPYGEELDELFWETIRLHGLEEQLSNAFQLTTPLWFGFWLNTPLRRPQCEALLELLPRSLPRLWGRDEDGNPVEAVFDRNQFVFPDFNPSEHYGREFTAFFRALQAAANWDLSVHVTMAPPGHADLGYFTEFPHCPRCKARASHQQDRKTNCKVCGHEFDPSKTRKMEPSKFDFEEHSLERQLGTEYDSFCDRYAVANGLGKDQMREALDNHRDGPNRRRIEKCRKQIRRLEKRYSEDVASCDWNALRPILLVEIAPGVSLELLRILPGEFIMGGTEESREKPAHKVRFTRGFYVGKYPVTQKQWEAVAGSNPSYCQGNPSHPVEQVTWFDAQDFCATLSKIARRHVRLPSEAEWEYACRAGTTTEYSFGDDISKQRANYDEDRDDPRTTAVDKFSPNPWGLCDVHGNVFEWCQDSWHENYDSAPSDGSAWLHKVEPVDHVARGGAAYRGKHSCRSAARQQERANCGARDHVEEQKDDDEMGLLFDLLNEVEFYGLRVVCSVIQADFE